MTSVFLFFICANCETSGAGVQLIRNIDISKKLYARCNESLHIILINVIAPISNDFLWKFEPLHYHKLKRL